MVDFSNGTFALAVVPVVDPEEGGGGKGNGRPLKP